MKKLHTILVMLIMAMTTFTLTGCEEDDDIAYTLAGEWKGNMYMQSTMNGQMYKSSISVLQFDQDPYRYAQGTGRWVDYYSNAPWDYFASYIDWRVVNGEIQIYSRSEKVTYYISDYRLNGRYFTGYIDDGYNDPVYFELVKTSGYYDDWDDYNWNGWGNDYDYDYRYAPAKISKKDAEKPVRGIYRK